MSSVPPTMKSKAAIAEANSAAPRANSTVQVSPPGTQNQIRRYQKYSGTQRRQVQLTQPGYELCIYSRFSQDKKADLYANTTNFTGYTDPTAVPHAGAGKNTFSGPHNPIVVPDFRFFSNTFNQHGPVLIGRDQNPVITNISAHQVVDNSTGSVGSVQLIQPDGIEFFSPTIGHAPPDYPDIDYHSSTNPNDGPLRVGVMDTLLIRMSNTLYDSTGAPQRVTETVFRGVIAEIRRTKNVNSGSTITLTIMDFSEFLRQITGLGMGIFSTSNFHLTGRGYITKLIDYSNGLYSGNKRILNVTEDVADQVGNQIEQSILTSFVNIVPAAGPLTTNAATGRANPNHAMSCAPLFWLQYQPHDKISIDNSTPPVNASTSSPVQAALNVAKDIQQGLQNLINQVTATITSDLNAIKAGQAASLLTPEDQESISAYKIFAGVVPQNIQKSVSSLFQQFNIALPSGAQLSEIAWALSDLYIEKGLISFAQEILWQSIWGVAERTMREAYFDFAPKLRPGDNTDPKAALLPFDTASVADIVAAGNQGLPDIHPNIGILKYRLSPCFIPYPSVKAAPKGQDCRVPNTKYPSQFRFYSFSDDDTIESDFSETEQNVFTAVFGFGNDIGKTSFTDTLKSLLDGQSQGLIATAETLDTRLESRLGYRFKTDHDEGIRIPIIMYLVSYSLLHKSQANMFQQSLTIPGDPRVQPGSIVQVQALNADFYCTQVLHTWDLGGGYTTQLQLQYGHTSGTYPQMLQAYGTTETGYDSTQNSCALSTMQMQSEGLSKLQPIGGINQGCLIYALQQYAQSFSVSANNPTLGAAPTSWYPNGSGALNDSQLQQLWISAGGNPSLAPVMAWIALGESSGNPNANNTMDNKTLAHPEGTQTSSGLWQVSTGTHDLYPNVFDPYANAQIAIQKQKYGFGQWNLQGLDPTNLPAAFNQINSHYQPPGRVQQLLGGSPNFTATNVQAVKWPYNVYGPIGMQLTSWNKGVGGSSDSAMYKKQLLDKTQGLTDSIAYIKHLSTKYAAGGANFAPYANVAGASDFNVVNQSDKLSKVIAAWFCDDGSADISKYNPGFLNTVIAQVKSLYMTCTTCAASTITPLNAASASEMGLTSTLADRQALVNSGHIKCTYAAVESDLLDPNKTSGDLIVSLSKLINHGGYYIGLTAINTGHGDDGTGPDRHASGYAVDCWPYTDSTMTTFVSENPAITPNLIQFLKDVNALPTVLQIGLAGSARNYPANYVAAGSSTGQPGSYLQPKIPFEDNGDDHIHVGFK